MRFLIAFGLAFAALGGAAYACTGDLAGFWEKRGPGEDEPYEVIEEFRIDTETRKLSICGTKIKFRSSVSRDEGQIAFGYRREKRKLTEGEPGIYLSETWEAEAQGIVSEYRIRVIEE